jgi:homoserine kinase type II
MVKTVSVYTKITEQELKQFLTQYQLGSLTSFEGISAGIENTNYFVNTTKGGFVLTIFEHHTINELDYFLQIMAFMAEHSVPTAHPEYTKDGKYLTILKNKPAALIERLEGGG